MLFPKKKDTTPLMAQYYDIKAKYPDTLLLFRMGDFFECFDDDAALLSKIGGIALTKRNNGNAEASPLAGFPHHQLDSYLPKLVKAGLRVAVCEQIEDPKYKTGKIVKREVIEVVTPGISMYDKLLESNRNNFICSVYLQKNKDATLFAGVGICDISTGEFLVGEVRVNQIVQIIEQYSPTEIIFSKSQVNEVENILSQSPLNLSHTKLEEWVFEQEFSRELLLRQFQKTSFKGFGIESLKVGISAAGVILHYISETQKQTLPQIQTIRLLNLSDRMLLDYSTRRNLEILQNREGEANGSLIKLLDKTSTPPGARLLRKWLNQPLNSLDAIHDRLDAVEYLVENPQILEKLTSMLHNLGDIERLISRIGSGKATTRDVVNLSCSLDKIPQIKNIFNPEKNNDISKN
jgi:DNA mismatch repair protein MutS